MKKWLFFLLVSLLVWGCDGGNIAPPGPHNATAIHHNATQTVQQGATPKAVPSGTLPKFAELPPEVQAVVVSLEFHLGSKGAAKYVRHIAKGELPAAIALLEAEKGVFANRRKAEAKLLRKALGKR